MLDEPNRAQQSHQLDGGTTLAVRNPGKRAK